MKILPINSLELEILIFIILGLSVVGGRVPDLIFSQADRPIFEGLLRRWKLDCIPPNEPEKFCDQLISHLRNCFQTHKLQQLHSKEHKRFDKTSDALIELFGIPADKRKGTDCSSNCSASLIFLGDCREHAIEMCAFFDFWQKYTIDNILRSSFLSMGQFEIHENSFFIQHFQEFIKLEENVDDILSTQLRAGHVGIYSFIQMENKYEPVGWEDEKPMKFRRFTLDSLKNKEKLTDYELQHSFVLLKYGKRMEDSFVIMPEWDDAKQKMQLPNENGVLKIENLDVMESLELYNLVEEHAMTFLVREKGSSFVLQCKDSFYNETFNNPNHPEFCSPYNLANQILDLNELEYCGGMSIGTKKNVWDEENNRFIETTIRIRLLPYSKRNDAPIFQFNPQKVRFMGLCLDYVDIVGELSRETKEREIGQKSRRDRFLQLVYRYGKQNKSQHS